MYGLRKGGSMSVQNQQMQQGQKNLQDNQEERAMYKICSNVNCCENEARGKTK